MEGKLYKVFKGLGVTVKPDDIEACHRLYNDKKNDCQNLKTSSVNKFCK